MSVGAKSHSPSPSPGASPQSVSGFDGHETAPGPAAASHTGNPDNIGRHKSLRANPFLEALHVELPASLIPTRASSSPSLHCLDVTSLDIIQGNSQDITQHLGTSGQALIAGPAAVSSRAQTLPADALVHSDLYALHQPAGTTSLPLSPFQTIQTAPSLSRRTSLANMLQRMASKADSSSTEGVETSNSARPPSSPAASIDIQGTHLGVTNLSSSNLERPSRVSFNDDVSNGMARQISKGIDRKAADVRLHRFREQGSLPYSSGQSQHSGDEIDQHKSPSVTGSLQTAHSVASQAQAPVMKRTISDVALEALESVESLKCPVIQYSALQFKRKIGQGSVGQVCLPSSSVPFTLACVHLASVRTRTQM